ncbi:MAG: NAD-dependent DNA ligase LigA [Clostridia bacterium]|nr:NAD-dependent DNA ligase LigA [Clostridia bacterium]MDD4375429.1 NAD-dependent DNA ligase LigA [Clostridia bacterium]
MIILRFVSGKEQVINAIKEIGELRNSLDYGIDGAVIKINDLKLREALGSTSRQPKWAIAYKYPPEEKETIITRIELNVGRTGKITPVAVLEPRKIAGSTVSRATLNNFDYIRDKDIREGDHIIIRKAGDIIPEIVSVLTDKRDGTQKEYKEPTRCPVCKEEVERPEGEVNLRCVNSECESQIYRAILHFASRNCMDIEDLGEKVVELLLESGKVKDVADLYYLTYEDVMELEGFQTVSAGNLIKAIKNSKDNTLDKLIAGFGINGIGRRYAKILAAEFADIYELMNVNVERLSKIKGFKEKKAEYIIRFMNRDKTKKTIEKLDTAGVNLKGSKRDILSKKLDGMKIAITGSFDGYSREDIAEIIEENGGMVTSSISSKTNLLIAGENSGSKLIKAQENKVRVVELGEFLKEYKL